MKRLLLAALMALLIASPVSAGNNVQLSISPQNPSMGDQVYFSATGLKVDRAWAHVQCYDADGRFVLDAFVPLTPILVGYGQPLTMSNEFYGWTSGGGECDAEAGWWRNGSRWAALDRISFVVLP